MNGVKRGTLLFISYVLIIYFLFIPYFLLCAFIRIIIVHMRRHKVHQKSLQLLKPG